MPADRAFKGFELHHHLGFLEVACSWCGSSVPLPAGDFSGVCIDCGTVMFRRSCRGPAEDEECDIQMSGRTVQAPAV